MCRAIRVLYYDCACSEWRHSAWHHCHYRTTSWSSWLHLCEKKGSIANVVWQCLLSGHQNGQAANQRANRTEKEDERGQTSFKTCSSRKAPFEAQGLNCLLSKRQNNLYTPHLIRHQMVRCHLPVCSNIELFNSKSLTKSG